MAKHRTKSRLWPGLVFALIGLNMCIVGLTVVAAHAHSRSFSVEPDFDRKALHWEESVRQAKQNAALGWTVQIDSVSHKRLTISLLDRAGTLIDGATVEGEVFHHAGAGRRSVVRLHEAPAGRYEGDITLDTPGLWEFRFCARRGPDTVVSHQTRMIMEDPR